MSPLAEGLDLEHRTTTSLTDFARQADAAARIHPTLRPVDWDELMARRDGLAIYNVALAREVAASGAGVALLSCELGRRRA